MPIFEYLCKDCEAVLELFLQTSDPHPRLCGYRCALGPDSGRAERGFGQLTRQLSSTNTVKHPHIRRDVPDAADMERGGFSAWKNEGGKLERIAGDAGPKIVKE